MRTKTTLRLALFVLAFAFVPAFAQAPVPLSGKIHGHVQDPGAVPMPNALVILSTDGVTAKYTFNTDQSGDYTGSGIAPGTYVVTLYQTAGKSVDRFTGVKIDAGADVLQDFDLTRPEYLASLPPDQRKAIEDARTKNASIIKENQGISKLNGMLKDARADNQAKKFDDAANIMQQAVVIKADAPVLWLEYGIAQNGQKKYDDAITSFKKAIDLDAAAKKPSPEIEAAADNGIGESLASSNKVPDAVVAYDAAAKLLPANANMYYTNEAIVLSRTSDLDATAAAADKAIAIDPTKPLPYYLKGQAMIAKATVDPKTQKITAPPGTADAYKKYLELAPTGPFAPTAQQILAEIGETVNSKYSAGKKH